MNTINAKYNLSYTSVNYNNCKSQKSESSINRGHNLTFGGGIGVYAGSFDPITNGHLDIIKKAAKIFDRLKVLVAINPDKQGFIPIEKRVQLIKECVQGLENVDVDNFLGLTIDFAKKNKADFLVRGIRNQKDIESELELAKMNNVLDSSISTIYIQADTALESVSSTLVRGVANYPEHVSKLVPEPVSKFLSEFTKAK